MERIVLCVDGFITIPKLNDTRKRGAPWYGRADTLSVWRTDWQEVSRGIVELRWSCYGQGESGAVMNASKRLDDTVIGPLRLLYGKKATVLHPSGWMQVVIEQAWRHPEQGIVADKITIDEADVSDRAR